jgi:hypothetical protein
MAMSAWGLLAAPLMAQASPAPATPISEPAAVVATGGEAGDLFSDLAAMDEGAMADAAGGESVAVDISNLGVNLSEQSGDVSNTTANGTTGQIANNSVNGNGGITTVFNNTGNGVIFQSTVNVNIFTGGSN